MDMNGFKRFAAAVTLVAVSAFPAGVSAGLFPLTSGDISSAADWGGTLPGPDEHLAFKSGTYTMTNDCTFASVTIRGKDVTFDFTDGNHTLTLTEVTNGWGGVKSLFEYPKDYNNSTTILKGGIWYSPDKEPFWVATLGNTDHSSYTFIMTNACLITNVDFRVARRMNNVYMLVADGSKVHCSKAPSNGPAMSFSDVSGTNPVLEVTGRSNVTVDGSMFSDDFGRTGAPLVIKGLIDVHGKGSSFLVNGALCWGRYISEVGLRVRDEATISVGSQLVLCRKYSNNDKNDLKYYHAKDNWVEILDNATATVQEVVFNDIDGRITVSNAVFNNPGGVFFGAYEYSDFAPTNCRNRLEFLDGAEASVGAVFPRTGHNTVIVSNSTLNITGNNCGLSYTPDANCNTFILSGADTAFNYKSSMIRYGTGHVFRIENGAQWKPYTSSLTLFRSSNCTMKVTSGAVFDNSTPGSDSPVRNTYIADSQYSDEGLNIYPYTNVVNNVLEVSDGAVFKADNFWVHGQNNRVVLSNATMTVGSTKVNSEGKVEKYSIWLGRGSMSTNCMLVLAGRTPTFRTVFGGSIIFQSKSIVRFEVPAEGYPEGHVVMTVGGFNLSGANSRLEIECADWAAGAGIEPEEAVLVRFEDTNGDPIKITADVRNWIYSNNPNPPDNVRIIVRGSELILRRKSPGLIFTVR